GVRSPATADLATGARRDRQEAEAGGRLTGAKDAHSRSVFALSHFRTGKPVPTFPENALMPQLLGCEPGAFGKHLQLRPGDLRMDAAAEAAVRAGDDVLAADNLGVAHDAVGHHLRMFDDIGGVADDAGDEQLAVR